MNHDRTYSRVAKLVNRLSAVLGIIKGKKIVRDGNKIREITRKGLEIKND